MKVPNADRAMVDREKIVDYLLNATHPDNGGKAQFFLGCGFKLDNWAELAGALQELVLRVEVWKSLESSHGHKYVVEGRIETPVGKTPVVRAVWIIDRGSERPRLVTAYPREERD